MNVKKIIYDDVEERSASLELRLMGQDDPEITDEERANLDMEVYDHVDELLGMSFVKARDFLKCNKDRFSPNLKDLLSSLVNGKKKGRA